MNDAYAMLARIVIITVFLYPLIYYTFFNRGDTTTPKNNITTQGNQSQQTLEVVPARPRKIIEQPSCPAALPGGILRRLCEDLLLRHRQCTPEDFDDLEKHKPPKPIKVPATNTTGDPRGTIVGCIASGLLLMSLGAAFVELYKAKSHSPQSKTKATINRKCSLADLTVLKHARKELVRRESIMEIGEEVAGKAAGRKVSRPPLRLD